LHLNNLLFSIFLKCLSKLLKIALYLLFELFHIIFLLLLLFSDDLFRHFILLIDKSRSLRRTSWSPCITPGNVLVSFMISSLRGLGSRKLGRGCLHAQITVPRSCCLILLSRNRRGLTLSFLCFLGYGGGCLRGHSRLDRLVGLLFLIVVQTLLQGHELVRLVRRVVV
jgi:hypothetical protein